MASSLAVDESSDIRGDSSLNMTEEFLALRPVHGTTTGQDLYEEVSRCGNEMELPREKLVGWTTDGAPAMCGHRSGLVAKIREKMQEENVTAELTAHHCVIHLESLCAEALNMEHGMFTITHAGNFIRAKEQLEKKGKDFMASSLAVDESSDIRGDSSLNMTEEFLALRPVHGTTTGQDLYEEVSRCGNEMELPREKLVGWTTDGAPAMCGHRSGLVAKIREKMQEENVTAELTAHHCVIHLESLCAEALNMEHGMFTITHAGNFIRAKGLIQRQFKAFLSQWQTQRGALPHHTEVRWLSQGKVLQRCFQLPEEIGCVLGQQRERHNSTPRPKVLV
ncbi:Protein FAM200B [Takifugu flavidus]|uniref:Protein FAM200B n=1 Tax=Takifugu flavidus TaxID=433684 RepID=A0A5C6NMX6_9TELE|nr:Protein FAM200B [Takifugu flavidus]